MLELFVAISLDSLQQRRECLLLFLSKNSLLFFNGFLDLVVHLLHFLCLHFLRLNLHQLSFVVSLLESQFPHFVFEFHEFAGMSNFLTMLSPDFLVQLLNFKLVFLFQFLQTEVSSGFVVTHVVVPSARELQKLRSLRAFDCNELLLLRLPHVLQLSEHLFILQVFKLELGSLGFRQVHLCAALLTVIIQKSKQRGRLT